MYNLHYKNGLLYASVILNHGDKSIIIDDVIVDTGAYHTIISKCSVVRLSWAHKEYPVLQFIKNDFKVNQYFNGFSDSVNVKGPIVSPTPKIVIQSGFETFTASIAELNPTVSQ